MTPRECAERLRNAGIEDAATDTRLLFSAIGKVDPARQLSDNPDVRSEALAEAIERRVRREPLGYILGTVAFYTEEYEVSPACLIPRPDTEILVEEALRRLPENARVLDLGTGSGCVAISVAAHAKTARVTAVDCSEEALAVARRNALKNGVGDRVTFLCRDMLLPTETDEPFDAILSNPPYIRSDVLGTLSPEVMAEPRLALDGGADGLLFYRKILDNCKHLLSNNGFFAFEIGYDQGESLRLLGESHGFSVQIIPDLGGRDRVAILR